MEPEPLRTALQKLGIKLPSPAENSGKNQEKDSFPENEPTKEPCQTHSVPMKLIGRNSPEWWCKAMNLDITHHALVGRMALFCGSFLSHAIRNESESTKWLVIEGGVGVGKSHASRWVIRAFNDWIWDFILAGHTRWGAARKPSAGFVNWSKFCLREERDENEFTLNDHLACDLLVIDDVGAEADRFKNGAHQARLRDFLEDCRNKWVIINTNVEAKSWQKIFGQRVADRLDSARHCDMTGVESYRRKK